MHRDAGKTDQTLRAMPKTIHYTLLSVREMLNSAGPFIVLTVGLLVLAYWWLDPTPPRHVTLATGPAQSAYDEFGKRYAQAMLAYGVQVRLLPSEGSSQNLEWLTAGKADLGFLPGSLEEKLEPWMSAVVDALAALTEDRSYLSARDPRQLFGLGTSERIDKLTVTWPSGVEQSFSNLPADRYWRLTEGSTSATALPQPLGNKDQQ